MPLRGHDAFRTVHLWSLAIAAIMLPWSTAFLSIAQMLMVVNWLAEGIVRKDLTGRFRTTFTSKPALVFLSFFGLHVVGLLWTERLGVGHGSRAHSSSCAFVRCGAGRNTSS